jgi:hypothetical protein
MEIEQATILDGTDSNDPLGSKVKERIIERSGFRARADRQVRWANRYRSIPFPAEQS